MSNKTPTAQDVLDGHVGLSSVKWALATVKEAPSFGFNEYDVATAALVKVADAMAKDSPLDRETMEGAKKIAAFVARTDVENGVPVVGSRGQDENFQNLTLRLTYEKAVSVHATNMLLSGSGLDAHERDFLVHTASQLNRYHDEKLHMGSFVHAAGEGPRLAREIAFQIAQQDRVSGVDRANPFVDKDLREVYANYDKISERLQVLRQAYGQVQGPERSSVSVLVAVDGERDRARQNHERLYGPEGAHSHASSVADDRLRTVALNSTVGAFAVLDAKRALEKVSAVDQGTDRLLRERGDVPQELTRRLEATSGPVLSATLQLVTSSATEGAATPALARVARAIQLELATRHAEVGMGARSAEYVPPRPTSKSQESARELLSELSRSRSSEPVAETSRSAVKEEQR